jgi:predicted RNA-binding protein YlxR (DUF448 family)
MIGAKRSTEPEGDPGGDKVSCETPGPEDKARSPGSKAPEALGGDSLGEEDGDAEATGPLRRCLVTREIRPKSELLRFVVGPDDRLLTDPAERMPGRGLWLTPRRDIVATAAAKGLFAKAARRRVVLPSDLAGEVEQLLRARCLALLGLARRAGQLRTGFEKVREDLKAGRAGLLLAARDGAPDGRQKLAALLGDRVPVALFDSEELSLALGRERVVHAVVAEGGIAQQLRRDLDRLQGMQAADSSPTEI